MHKNMGLGPAPAGQALKGPEGLGEIASASDGLCHRLCL